MNKVLKKFLFVLLVIVTLCITGFFLMKNLDYFKLRKVSVYSESMTGEIGESAKSIVSGLSEKNIFDVSTFNLASKIKSTPCVKSVSVKKSYPSKIYLTIQYETFDCRMYTESVSGIKYYLSNTSGIKEVSKDIYDLYDPLLQVKISETYANALRRWSIDQGYVQLLKLITNINKNILITELNYDNNKGGDFGTLELDVLPIDVRIFVKEPVTPETLNTALNLLLAEDSMQLVEIYDLYANGLFGRTGEEVK